MSYESDSVGVNWPRVSRLVGEIVTNSLHQYIVHIDTTQYEVTTQVAQIHTPTEHLHEPGSEQNIQIQYSQMSTVGTTFLYR